MPNKAAIATIIGKIILKENYFQSTPLPQLRICFSKSTPDQPVKMKVPEQLQFAKY